MASNPSSEPSEAAGSIRCDGSPFTPLWPKVNFSMTSLPNITAPRRPPPAGVLTDLLPKKWTLAEVAGSKAFTAAVRRREAPPAYKRRAPNREVHNFPNSYAPSRYARGAPKKVNFVTGSGEKSMCYNHSSEPDWLNGSIRAVVFPTCLHPWPAAGTAPQILKWPLRSSRRDNFF